MADFLGLGIAFSGIDRGLDDSLKKSQSQFEDTREEIEATEEAANGGGKKGGIFSGIVEGVKLLSIGQIGNQLEDFSEGLAGTERQVDDVFKSLDTLEAKITGAFDTQTAMQFRGALDGVMISSGVSAENAEQLALGMVKFGRTTEESMKALPTMGKLVGVLGIEADRVAQMYGSGLAQLRATPKQMDKIVKQTVKLQKSYGLTDQVSVLPEIFETVTANAAKFGKVNTDAALQSTMGITRLSAVFQKLGKSQEQAVTASLGFENTLSDMRTAILDMQVGLPANTEGINDLAEALAIAGVQDPFGAITANFDSVEDMSEFLRTTLAGLDEGTRLAVTQRLRRIFGDDVTNMVGAYGEDAEKVLSAAEEQGAELGTAEEEFAKLEQTMKNTVDVQERLRDSAKDLLDITLQRATKTKLMQVLQDERSAYLELNTAVGDQNSLLGRSMLLFHQLKSLGLRALFDSEMISMASIFLGVLGGFIFPLTQIVGLFSIFKAPIGMVTSGLMGLGSGMISVTKSMFSMSGGLTLLKSGMGALKNTIIGVARVAFPAIGKAMVGLFTLMTANPIGLTITAIVGLGAALVGLIVYWDDVKAAMSSFFNWAMQGISAFAGYWDDAQAALANFFTWAVDGLASFAQFYKDTFMSVFSFIGDLFTAFQEGGISAVWDTLKTGAMDALSSIQDFFAESFNNIAGSLKEAMMFIPNFLKRMWTKAVDAVPGFVKKFIGIEADDSQAKQDTGTKGSGFFSSFFGDDENTPEQSPGQAGANVFTSSVQQGAPRNMRSAISVPPEPRREVADENFQALIDQVAALQTALVEALNQLAGSQQVNVQITGEMAKFLRAIKQNNMNVAGANSIAHAVNR